MPSLETGDGSGEFLPQRHKDTTIFNPELNKGLHDIGTGPELNKSWQDIGTSHEKHPSTLPLGDTRDRLRASEKTRNFFTAK